MNATTFLSLLERNFSARVAEVRAELVSRGLKPDRAEDVVIGVMLKHPVRLSFLRHEEAVDPDTICAWVSAFFQQEERSASPRVTYPSIQ